MWLYSTLGRKKEEFKPIVEGKVGIYSCGPTVYWDQHLGNMYAYLFADVLVRTFLYLGYEVKQVMNLTDVGCLTSDADEGEDKMEKGARREGISVWEVAKKYEKQFFESEELLNIVRPEVVCAATKHIDEQISLILKIEANGYTYVTSDGVYFDTGKFKGYADFARLKIDKLKEKTRDIVESEKRNPSDFALWKFSYKKGRPFDRTVDDETKKRQMEWESPWGVGFPGWHIECTAMSVKYLGENFDIHTGGIDHIPVHHTNEIAQGFGAFGHQTANYWVHNAFVTGKGGVKMSKSLGNLFLAQDLVEMKIDPLAFRYLFLTTHYRKGMEFSLDSLKSAEVALGRLRAVVGEADDGGVVNEEYKKMFEEKVADDLSMSEALAVAWRLAKDSEVNSGDKKATLLDFDRVLGLKLGEGDFGAEDIPDLVKELAANRQKARETKDWKRSDELRDEIKKMGFEVEDSASGQRLKKIS